MTNRLQHAIDFMKAAHRSIGQTRKDGVRPYEVHPMAVMERVQAVTDDEDVLIAALFHDIIEDVMGENPFYDIYRIAALFGERVAKLVTELTDVYTKESYPDKNRKARKQLERERYATFSPEAKLIKLADIAENLSDDALDAGFMVMFIKEKALCLPYLVMKYAERNEPFYWENDTLFREAVRVLNKQKIKFDVW